MVAAKLVIQIDVKDLASADIDKLTKKYGASVKRMDDAAERSAKKQAISFEKIKKGVGLLQVAMASFVIIGIKKLVSLSSAAEETQSKFNVVFRDTQQQANLWVNDLSKSLGLARSSLQRFASEIGDVLKPLGFTTQVALDMSKVLTELAIDLASFNNVDFQQSVNAVKSALVGEREALKTLGVVIREVDLKEEKRKLGLIDATLEQKKMNDALATQSLLFKNSRDAQGDFKRTQDSTANSTKILLEQLKQVGEEFGDKLSPAIARANKQMAEFLKNVGDSGSPLTIHQQHLEATDEKIRSIKDALGLAGDEVKGTDEEFNVWTANLSTMITALQSTETAIEEITKDIAEQGQKIRDVRQEYEDFQKSRQEKLLSQEQKMINVLAEEQTAIDKLGDKDIEQKKKRQKELDILKEQIITTGEIQEKFEDRLRFLQLSRASQRIETIAKETIAFLEKNNEEEKALKERIAKEEEAYRGLIAKKTEYDNQHSENISRLNERLRLEEIARKDQIKLVAGAYGEVEEAVERIETLEQEYHENRMGRFRAEREIVKEINDLREQGYDVRPSDYIGTGREGLRGNIGGGLRDVIFREDFGADLEE